MDNDLIIDGLLNKFKLENKPRINVQIYLMKLYFKDGLTAIKANKLILDLENLSLIKRYEKSFLHELDTLGIDALYNYGGWLKYLDKIKLDKDASNKKSKLELFKIKTDIVKNSISIFIFMVSLVLNGLYIFGIITFNFSTSDKNMQIVKDKIETLQKDTKYQKSSLDKNKPDSNQLNLPNKVK